MPHPPEGTFDDMGLFASVIYNVYMTCMVLSVPVGIIAFIRYFVVYG